MTALTVAALALGAAKTQTATVTLQVAPRGPGSVAAVPGPVGDTSPCTGQDSESDCDWTYERGTSVRLTATADAGPGRSFSHWSDPDCGTSSSCTVKVDDDLTSIVAVFSPLTLGVKFSGNAGGATVTSNPAGQSCPGQLEEDELFCRTFPPGTRVALTLAPATAFSGWNQTGNYLCEPTTAPTCTIAVEDEPTWAGVRFGNAPPPSVPTTISVEFRLRKTGNGSGRVTASRLDCGTVCNASYGFGRPITLTAEPTMPLPR